MPRSAALKPEQLPAGSKPILDTFTKNIGFTPNMMATFAQSPIAFNSWATLLGSLNQALDVKTRDSIGLAVSEEWLQLLSDGPQLYGRAYGQAAGR
jgi:hypothetical protein